MKTEHESEYPDVDGKAKPTPRRKLEPHYGNPDKHNQPVKQWSQVKMCDVHIDLRLVPIDALGSVPYRDYGAITSQG